MLHCTLSECMHAGPSERQSQQSPTDMSAAVPKLQSAVLLMQQCVLSICVLMYFLPYSLW